LATECASDEILKIDQYCGKDMDYDKSKIF